MPVIVVGADTPLGGAIVGALAERGGEIRAFVGDGESAKTLRALGVKVAVGDMSDGSHLTAASHQAFTAVCVEAALHDGRPFAFAADADGVVDTWRTAIRDAGVRRAIWVGTRSPAPLLGCAPDVAAVQTQGRPEPDIAREVADLNDRAGPAGH